MSFFAPTATAYKPQIRQEGFHLPSPPPSVPSPSMTDNMFGHHSLDLSDELASLMPQGTTSHERSTHTPDEHPYRHTHNIFDIGLTQQQHQQQQMQSYPYDYHTQQQHTPLPPGFNSTLPALGSSLRYEDANYHPHHQQRAPSSNRSRSRSRDVHAGSLPVQSANGGPTRTQRAKRGSLSSTSPPRGPHAILIPPHARAQQQNPVSPLSLHSLSTSTPAWFPNAASHGYDALPTPDSLGGPAFGSYTSGAGLGVSPKDSVSDMPSVGGVDTVAKQAAIANEKRRRRRESHNAVERRRRDNINEKIAELATLIPESLLDSNVTPLSPTEADISSPLAGLVPAAVQAASPREEDKDEKDRDGGVKANKGMILRKSVEYIRYLQQLVQAQAARNRELEARLGPGSSSGLSSFDGEGEMTVLGNGMGDYGLFGERRSLERVLEHENEMDVERKGLSGSALSEGSPEDSSSVGLDDESAERGRARTRVKEEGDADDMEVS
ncbi:HLH-domain-containing protein [Peniophora sp. CONT]|nr:HLH-domain-containing protein [Peniophora sp. CONT]